MSNRKRKDPPAYATITDVARMAGVSTATVSRTLNSPEQVQAETTGKVMKAVKKLGYVPQSAARNLASRKTNTVGLLLPSIGEDFFGQMLRGVEAEVAQAGYDLLVATKPESQVRVRSTQPLGRHNTDGILIFTGNIFEAEILPMYGEGFPMVLLYQSPPKGLKIPYVTVENKDGSRALVDHLIEEHGYRKIAFLRGPEGNEDSHWRERGFRESMERHGQRVDESLIEPGLFNEEAARQAVTRMLAAGKDFRAIFAGSDENAIGALTALAEAHIAVPEQVAVVGFDDLNLARFTTPPLTTVRAPTEKVGREAVATLFKLIRGEVTEEKVLLQTEVIIRQSCGCIRKEA
jgi:LacI family transcriptional regulator